VPSIAAPDEDAVAEALLEGAGEAEDDAGALDVFELLDGFEEASPFPEDSPALQPAITKKQAHPKRDRHMSALVDDRTTGVNLEGPGAIPTTIALGPVLVGTTRVEILHSGFHTAELSQRVPGGRAPPWVCRCGS
jgi:hypothetical protein